MDIKHKTNPEDQICAHCKHFAFAPGGPVCNNKGTPFLNPRGWAKSDGSKPPGKRACKKWEQKSK